MNKKNNPVINKKILIVEDDEDFLFILKKRLTFEGFSVVTAEDGEEGISTAEREKPDLIITDVLIPKIDGIAMIKKIREFNSNVKIIFLTNIKDTNYIASLKGLGGFDYLIKSELIIKDVVATIKNRLRSVQ